MGAQQKPIVPKRMVVNMATVTGGGGLQASVSFVESVAQAKIFDMSFFFIFSLQVYNGLGRELTDRLSHVVLSGSPANPWFGRNYRKTIQEVYETERPDIVYSIGFPSYVKAPKIEVGRYTNGWEFLEFDLAWQQLSIAEKLLRTIKNWYRRSWAKKATHFETQTIGAKSGLSRILGVEPVKIEVVPNSLNKRFLKFLDIDLETEEPPKEPYQIFCFAAEHKHKNLLLCVETSSVLSEHYGLVCRFIFTLNPDSKIWQEISLLAKKLGVQEQMCNLGPINLDESIDQYAKSHCVFIPSLAEIFSATYIEAMAMRVPVVTSDLSFAREVCGNAAEYFNPLDPYSAAEALSKVLSDSKLRYCMVKSGLWKVRSYPTSETKNQNLLKWMSGLNFP